MAPLKQQRTSIDYVPLKKAALIAEEIFSWGNVKASGLRKMIPNEEGREAAGKR